MNLAADMGRHSGRATPSLHDTPHRHFEETTGRQSTYLLPIAVQTNRATSMYHTEKQIGDQAVGDGSEPDRHLPRHCEIPDSPNATHRRNKQQCRRQREKRWLPKLLKILVLVTWENARGHQQSLSAFLCMLRQP